MPKEKEKGLEGKTLSLKTLRTSQSTGHLKYTGDYRDVSEFMPPSD